jgi:TatD DNase family protein
MSLLFDAHSHLQDAAPTESGLCRVVCGTCEADWGAVLAQAGTGDLFVPMLGLHPWQVADASDEWLFRLEDLLEAHRAGVGECGLDFARKETDRAVQEFAFRAQLRLAHTLHRPVAVHLVHGWGRLLDILREEGVPPAGAMVHAFSGSPETARVLQARGVFLSFSGDLLDPTRAKLRESLLAVDADHLLLETDGGADLRSVLEAAAGLRQEPVWELEARIWENGQRCFKELLA